LLVGLLAGCLADLFLHFFAGIHIHKATATPSAVPER
jgi:hypothetical protein